MAILLNNNGYGNVDWQQQFSLQLPDMPVHVYPSISNKNDIRYAVVWDHPKGDLKGYQNLKAIFSLGAGMEHLLNDGNLPDVPLVPLLDPVVAVDMANYALFWVMNSHRQYSVYREQQTNQIWKSIEVKPASDFKVTVLGLGRIAQKLLQTITHAGYSASAWDFKQKELTQNYLKSIKKYGGVSELYTSINNADVVINCLPFNQRTKSLINTDFLAQMMPQATFINISRGAVVNEQDLFDALNNETIKSAVLDVTQVEPLSPENPLWNHPKITITPHISGATYARSGASVIVNNIKRIENGEMPEGVFDLNRGK